MASVDTRLVDGDHVVTFYAADDQLIAALATRFAPDLTNGDAVIVIATDAHRTALERALAGYGIDAGEVMAAGQLVMLDAEATLAQFLRSDGPDGAAFEAAVGAVLRRAAHGGRSVHAFGEMVSLLWDEGDVTSAMELEQLWNTLAEKIGFSLVCGYRQGAFDDAAAGDRFDRVCRVHSGVIGGAPGVESLQLTRRLPCSKGAPRLARRFVADVLRHWGRHELVDDAILVIGELSTNAVVHAESDMTVGISRIGDGVRLVVTDAAGAPPIAQHLVSSDALGGRGLAMVETIARRCGHFFVAGGKVCWAEVFPSADWATG